MRSAGHLLIIVCSLLCKPATAGTTWAPALGTNTTTVVIYSATRIPYTLGNHLELLLAHLRQFQTRVETLPLAQATVAAADYVIVYCPRRPELIPSWITNRSGPTLWLGVGSENLPTHLPRHQSLTDLSALTPLLFELYGITPPERGQLLLRIDDYGCRSDHRQFRRTADLLFARGIPFVVGVLDCDLSGNEEFVRSLRYAENRGGRLVLQTSFQFWNSASDREVTVDASEQLQSICAAFAQHGLTLRGWKNAGPSPPRRLEKNLAQAFPLRIGAVRLSDATSADEVLARNIILDGQGTVIVPGAFAHVPLSSTNGFAEMKRVAGELLSSRGAAGSLVFHAYLPFSTFVAGMDELESWDIAFVDLAELRR